MKTKNIALLIILTLVLFMIYTLVYSFKGNDYREYERMMIKSKQLKASESIYLNNLTKQSNHKI